jgi:hypothetical protein
MNEPTILDVILACVYGLPVVLVLLAGILPINWHYDPKGNDPYRYCPKEEE